MNKTVQECKIAVARKERRTAISMYLILGLYDSSIINSANNAATTQTTQLLLSSPKTHKTPQRSTTQTTLYRLLHSQALLALE